MSKGVSRAAPGVADLLDDLNNQPVSHVAVSAIKVDEHFNPRRLISEEALQPAALADLTENIKQFGVLQPLLVRRKYGKVVLVAGERRLRAAVAAGLTEVPVVYLDVDDARAYEIAIVENSQRQDLDIVTETLVGFDFLTKRLNMTQPEVVSYLHSVRNGYPDEHGVESILRTFYGSGVTTWALRRAAILKMTPIEWDAIRAKRVDAKVCAELTRLPQGEARAALLARAINEGLSAPQVRELVATETRSQDPEASLSARVNAVKKDLSRLARLKGDKTKDAERLLSELEDRLQELLAR